MYAGILKFIFPLMIIKAPEALPLTSSVAWSLGVFKSISSYFHQILEMYLFVYLFNLYPLKVASIILPSILSL